MRSFRGNVFGFGIHKNGTKTEPTELTEQTKAARKTGQRKDEDDAMVDEALPTESFGLEKFMELPERKAVNGDMAASQGRSFIGSSGASHRLTHTNPSPIIKRRKKFGKNNFDFIFFLASKNKKNSCTYSIKSSTFFRIIQ